MSSLQQQLEASKQKRRLASQIVVKRTVTHTNSNNNSNNFNKLHNKIADANRIQKKPNFDSLPVAGSKQRIIGKQLYDIIGFLRSVDEPQTAEDLEKNVKVNIYSSDDLYRSVTNNPKIVYDPDKETFAYKPEYDIKNKDDLLNLVREHRAMDVKELKDSYSNLMKAIKELEAEGDILIIYSKDTPRIIYANDKSLNVETDEEFKKLWHELTVPAAEDLSKELEKAGLPSMKVFETKVNPKNKVKKKSRQRNRKVKIMNTHLEKKFDFTKDYVADKDKK
ncbi:transcription initiation factor IIE, beta subunit [Anaeromyces robustus]|uniref:Transcription initiation factor IIE subunit beta n=1 Tax=Anaeromyces robustus TaxID=1754192 RepID=A0A1Y1WUT7_9FUNG|nr:transcription initiation factor IIE, beta subunit [Anaeromyces robustus]|eukprot:ORX77317.1 transcription initiation factor IIE, beta subunit [Anaeromyces robustus]